MLRLQYSWVCRGYCFGVVKTRRWFWFINLAPSHIWANGQASGRALLSTSPQTKGRRVNEEEIQRALRNLF